MVNIFRISSSLKMNALWTLSVAKAQEEGLDPGASPDRWDPRDRLEYQATREFRGECFRLHNSGDPIFNIAILQTHGFSTMAVNNQIFYSILLPGTPVLQALSLTWSRS